MPKTKDLTGKQFGWLVVQQQEKTPDRFGNLRWRCLCKCGMVCTAIGSQLKTGIKRSCGCLQRAKERKKIMHGRAASQQTRTLKRRLKELGL